MKLTASVVNPSSCQSSESAPASHPSQLLPAVRVGSGPASGHKAGHLHRYVEGAVPYRWPTTRGSQLCRINLIRVMGA